MNVVICALEYVQELDFITESYCLRECVRDSLHLSVPLID